MVLTPLVAAIRVVKISHVLFLICGIFILLFVFKIA